MEMVSKRQFFEKFPPNFCNSERSWKQLWPGGRFVYCLQSPETAESAGLNRIAPRILRNIAFFVFYLLPRSRGKRRRTGFLAQKESRAWQTENLMNA